MFVCVLKHGWFSYKTKQNMLCMHKYKFKQEMFITELIVPTRQVRKDP